MTLLAQELGNMIRERGGVLPSHDDWLEEKAEKIRKTVRREIYMDIKANVMMLDNPVPKEIRQVIEDNFWEML